jgi:peroxin-14
VRDLPPSTPRSSIEQKYLFPHLQPPSATAYEQDRDALTAQFEAAESLLKEIQTDTAAVRQAVEEQREKVDKATEDVQAAVTEMREGEGKTRDEMREIRDELNNVREMLPKVRPHLRQRADSNANWAL